MDSMLTFVSVMYCPSTHGRNTNTPVQRTEYTQEELGNDRHDYQEELGNSSNDQEEEQGNDCNNQGAELSINRPGEGDD